MLAIWKLHGFDTALKAALTSGAILAGLSAGSICWFEQGVTDSFGSQLQPIEGLGFLPRSHCPHYDGEKDRRPTYHRLIQQGMKDGYAADDGVGLHFINGQLEHIVSSRPQVSAYRIERDKEELTETALAPRFLGHSG